MYLDTIYFLCLNNFLMNLDSQNALMACLFVKLFQTVKLYYNDANNNMSF